MLVQNGQNAFSFLTTQNGFFGLATKSLETLGVVFVRTCVRLCVRASRVFSETVHYFFLKLYSYLWFVSARKMIQALF